MTGMSPARTEETRAVFAGRIDILYALGRHYLSLPFAVLCVPATLLAGAAPGLMPFTPLLIQMVVVIAAEQLTTAYKNRHAGAHADDPGYWARRYTFVSAIAGSTWGLGALFWFVWGSFAAQAYLALAFLGMTATEFIARSAHRPAFAAHTVCSLGPLVALLLLQGGLYAAMTALLVILFAAVLVSYCNWMARLLDESVSLRNENSDLVIRLSREKGEAIAARDSAEASALAKSSFIANISHELRTPLNALLGMAQLLERAELPKQQADHVKVMLEAGRGLQTLLDDVIALTRDDSEQLEDEDCDPLQTARAVVRLLQPRAWEKHLRLSLAVNGNLPRVAADPRKVRQVLLKLVDNGLKFTDRGLVDIRLDEMRSDKGRFVRFTVADTGHGVTPEVAEKLFSPFTLGDNSYTRKQQGAGLGLAVAKRIVAQAGGEIGFESTPGEGAQFFFTLPVSGAAGMASRMGIAGEASQPPPSGLHILLQTGTSGIASGIANLLEPFGNRVTIADSSADTIALAGRSRFDAIIVGAADADTIAAAPGVSAPLIAILLRGERAPVATDTLLRWPVEPDALYSALAQFAAPAPEEALMHSSDPRPESNAAIDAVAFSTLEKSVGVKALVDILQCYITTAEQLTNGLSEACAAEKWEEAGRLAQDIVGAAGGLGLIAVTRAARQFAQKTREGQNRHELRNAAQLVMGEHIRAKQALTHLYPDVA
jgi:signal transduction histidine kinase/HPt (histidine-containing phosphotransfer) domain-containing protein